MDEKELKIQALTERIAELTAGYENKVADLRVALTLQAQQLEDAKKENADVEVDESTRTGIPTPGAED